MYKLFLKKNVLSFVIAVIVLGLSKTILAQPFKDLLSIKGNELSIFYQGMAQNPVENQSAIGPEIPYILKCKFSQRVLDVRRAATTSEAQIWQWDLNATIAQRFIFQKADNDYFYIRPLVSGYYLTYDPDAHPSIIQRALFQPHLVFTADLRDVYQRKSKYDSLKYFQQWKVESTGEPFCFLITNRSLPNMALQPVNNSSGVEIIMNAKTGSDAQKWILKYIPFEENPNSHDAELNLNTDCNVHYSAYYFFTHDQDISKVFPEWRAVGETNVPNGTSIPFNSNIKILEGQVKDGSASVSFEDLPVSHFTHDFNFVVIPDPPYRYLMSGNSNQHAMDVEWEAGISQGNDARLNPAAPFNRRGDSYGFFTAGHRRRDFIWNWPTNKDWVHVEGQWIWDRGHEPATEIHPPHFIGIKRYLPEKYSPNGISTQYVYATRCDVFANGDGSIMWNSKGHDAFAQHVKMSNKNYRVVFIQDLPKPTPTSILKVGMVNQNGDTYTGNPQIEINGKGTADIPQPHIVFTLPWASSRISDKAIFARTYFLYWDDVASHGVPPNYAIKTVRINLDSLVILKKMDGAGETAEFRFFANIGNKWFFLNEFTTADDILSDGLGSASGQGLWSIPEQYIFKFNLSYEFCIPAGKEVRMNVSGWEADYMDSQFGLILNPYLSCDNAIRKMEDMFTLDDYMSGGGSDDLMGAAERILKFNEPILPFYRINSKGEIDKTDEKMPNGTTDPNNAFKAVFKVLRL